MNSFNPTEYPHRRYNPLTGEWVLVSPHRNKQPWQGQAERPPQETCPPYDPTCCTKRNNYPLQEGLNPCLK